MRECVVTEEKERASEKPSRSQVTESETEQGRGIPLAVIIYCKYWAFFFSTVTVILTTTKKYPVFTSHVFGLFHVQ